MNKQKYSNNISKQKNGRLRSKQPTTKYSLKKLINTTSNLFTFIEISRMQKYSPSSVLIRLRYKRQDRIDNGLSCVKTLSS